MRGKGSFWILSAAALLAGGLLGGCIRQAAAPDPEASVEVKMESSATQSTPEKETYYAENLRETFTWCGKTVEEIGIPEEYLDRYSISLEGSLFDVTVTGDAYLLHPNGDSAGTVDRIVLTCRELSFPDAAARLKELYGPPKEQGEEPYAEINGGVVEWQRFAVETGAVTIYQASKYRFFTLEVTTDSL